MGTKRDQEDLSTQDSGGQQPYRGAEDGAGPAGRGLDDLDAAILRHLEFHGRATNYEVGEAVGLSASAASRRIQALEASGAIRGYRAQIDDRLLGKHMTVYIRVTLERQSAPVLAAFEAAVRRSKGITSCRHRRLRPPAPERAVAATGSDAAGNQLRAQGCAGRGEGVEQLAQKRGAHLPATAPPSLAFYAITSRAPFHRSIAPSCA